MLVRALLQNTAGSCVIPTFFICWITVEKPQSLISLSNGTKSQLVYIYADPKR